MMKLALALSDSFRLNGVFTKEKLGSFGSLAKAYNNNETREKT